jgi:hypothetical protein
MRTIYLRLLSNLLPFTIDRIGAFVFNPLVQWVGNMFNPFHSKILINLVYKLFFLRARVIGVS